VALFHTDMARPALTLCWQLQVQHVVPVSACHHAAWCPARHSLDAVPSQSKEDYIRGLYIEGSMPLEGVAAA